MATPRQDRPPEDVEVVRAEEEIEVGTRRRETGRVVVRKHIEHTPAREAVAVEAEHADIEREPADDEDEGDVRTLSDGSVSIPVFEERLVVEKRRVVKERVVVRKRTVTEEHTVEADLARERVEIDTDPAVADRVRDSSESEPAVADRVHDELDADAAVADQAHDSRGQDRPERG